MGSLYDTERIEADPKVPLLNTKPLEEFIRKFVEFEGGGGSIFSIGVEITPEICRYILMF